MYELIPVGAKTYYINCPAKMGVYQLSETEVCLIDSGNDKEAAKKILKILQANGWTLKMILSTHSHADHIGGNQLLQQRTGCPVYCAGIDAAFVQFPILESSFLYGGYPSKPLRNKFLCAQPSQVQPLTADVLSEGLEMLPLDGHSFSMSAIKTSDDVWFLADSLTSAAIIEKYHIPFLYDVAAYQESLQRVASLAGRWFIPAHADAVEDISPLVQLNAAKVEEIIALLQEICAQPIAFDDILQAVFCHYALTMDFSQNVLVGSTIRSYLTYLHDAGVLHASFADNKLRWCVQG